MATTTILDGPTCRHCHGTGQEEPVVATDATEATLMRELLDMGERLRELPRGLSTLTARTGIYDRIREIDASELVIRADATRLLGISRTAYYKILNRETGAVG